MFKNGVKLFSMRISLCSSKLITSRCNQEFTRLTRQSLPENFYDITHHIFSYLYTIFLDRIFFLKLSILKQFRIGRIIPTESCFYLLNSSFSIYKKKKHVSIRLFFAFHFSVSFRMSIETWNILYLFDILKILFYFCTEIHLMRMHLIYYGKTYFFVMQCHF